MRTVALLTRLRSSWVVVRCGIQALWGEVQYETFTNAEGLPVKRGVLVMVHPLVASRRHGTTVAAEFIMQRRWSRPLPSARRLSTPWSRGFRE